MYDPDLSKVRFTGPLAMYAPGWRAMLLADGYVACSAATKLQLAAHLSRWLLERNLDAWELTESVIGEFLAERRSTYTSQISLRALGPFLEYLQSLDAIPVPAPYIPVTDQQIVLAEYQEYLLLIRGLTGPVIIAYKHWITPFLAYLSDAGCRARAGEVNGAIVAEYLISRLPLLSRKSAKMTASVLRSFLGFLHAAEYNKESLAAAVPPIVSWRLAGLPAPLNEDETAALFSAVNRSTHTGKRDFAVLLLLLRLGLRRSEVAVLRLDDIDWAAGILSIHGKGGRIDAFPLPVDVGTALVDYLQHSRPSGLESREVFITAVAPFHGLSPVSVSYIVARLAKKAGIGAVFAHQLRHTAGSKVLNAGATMEEVAQFLRHNSIETSTIYAKTDMSRLRGLARPWPGLGASS